MFPVLFALILAKALKEPPDGVCFVDDCSWLIEFDTRHHFQEKPSQPLDQVHDKLSEHGSKMDEDKTEAQQIFNTERPRASPKKTAEGWKLRWRNITRAFDIKAKAMRWLGFFVDRKLN